MSITQRIYEYVCLCIHTYTNKYMCIHIAAAPPWLLPAVSVLWKCIYTYV